MWLTLDGIACSNLSQLMSTVRTGCRGITKVWLQAWALAGNLMSLLTASRTLTAQSKGAESRLRSISQQVHMPVGAPVHAA